MGWRFGSRHATAQVLTRARQQMRQEIRYWQEQAERSKVRADLLAQENEAWAAGYKQGREDVITIVPHITAQQQLPVPGRRDRCRRDDRLRLTHQRSLPDQ